LTFTDPGHSPVPFTSNFTIKTTLKNNYDTGNQQRQPAAATAPPPITTAITAATTHLRFIPFLFLVYLFIYFLIGFGR